MFAVPRSQHTDIFEAEECVATRTDKLARIWDSIFFYFACLKGMQQICGLFNDANSSSENV
jgi:hypothetical protein